MVMFPQGMGRANRPPMHPFLRQAIAAMQQNNPNAGMPQGFQQLPMPSMNPMQRIMQGMPRSNPMQGLQGIGQGMMDFMQTGQEPGQMTPEQRAQMTAMIAALVGRFGGAGGGGGMPAPRSNNPLAPF